MRVLDTLSLAVLLTVAGAAPVLAQQSPDPSAQTVSASAIDAALAGHESQANQHRARLADLLAHEDVRTVADQHGIDMGRVEAAAAGLSDAQVTSVAPLVAAALPAGGGGMGNVTISVAAIIIILLVLILVT